MAGKGNVFENDFLRLIFLKTQITNLCATPSPEAPDLYVSLHTADPLQGATDDGTQAQSETTYAGYARTAVVRTSSGWTVAASGGTVNPANPITFPECTTSPNPSQSITHFAIGMPAYGSFSQSTTTVTVTLNAHGLSANQLVTLNFLSGPATGIYTVATATTNTFTVTATTSATATGFVWVGGGPTKILYAGGITPQISILQGVQPRLTTNSVITED